MSLQDIGYGVVGRSITLIQSNKLAAVCKSTWAQKDHDLLTMFRCLVSQRLLSQGRQLH